MAFNQCITRHFYIFLIGCFQTYSFSQFEEEGQIYTHFDFLNEISVISSSKKEEKIFLAPSNITVITASRIRSLGLRNLRDVLAIVPGYFNNYDRDEWVPVARGIASDNSLQYMLLVDGQDIGIATSFGVSGAYELPNDLSNVKQIEIIRGPGSVIWGGSSLGGVVNIVTKDAESLSRKTQIDTALGTQNSGRLSFVTEKKFDEDFSYIVSGSYVVSDGDDIETDASTKIPVLFNDYHTDQDPFGRFVTAVDRIDPSYRLHIKGRLGDFGFAAYSFQNKIFNRQFEINQDREAWLKRRVYFLEGNWSKEIDDSQHIKFKFSAGKTEQEYFIEDAYPLIKGTSNPTFFTQGDDFLTLSVDGNLEFNFSSLSLEYGAEMIRRDLFHSLISPASLNSDFSPVTGKVFGRENDVTSGIYAVLLWKPILEWTFLMGGRAEYNGTRGKDSLITTPRLAAIWEIEEQNALKLLYNTGYRRPAPDREIFEAETVRQIELIWIRQFSNTEITLTGFWQTLENILFLTQGGLTAGGIKHYVSGGSEIAQGVELELMTAIHENLSLWLSLSLGKTEAKDYPLGTPFDARRITPNGDKLGYLSESLSAGCIFNLTDDLFFSPSLRYQGPIHMRIRPANQSLEDAIYTETDSVIYFDLNIGFTPQNKKYSIYVYGNNITDIKDPMPHVIRNGTRETYGSYYELKFSLNF